MPDTIEVTGLRELKQRMAEFPVKVEAKLVRQALRKAAARVVRAAKASAPRRTGAVRRNIKAKAGRKERGVVHVLVGVEHGKVPPVVGYVEGAQIGAVRGRGGKLRGRRLTAREKRGEDPYYWRFQELGFRAVGRARGRRKEGRIGRAVRRLRARLIPGRRFLTRAFEANAVGVLNDFRAVIEQGIDRV